MFNIQITLKKLQYDMYNVHNVQCFPFVQGLVGVDKCRKMIKKQ